MTARDSWSTFVCILHVSLCLCVWATGHVELWWAQTRMKKGWLNIWITRTRRRSASGRGGYTVCSRMSSSFLSSSSTPPAVIILCKHDNRLVELRSSDTFDKDDDNFGLLKFKSTFIHSFIQVVSGYYSHPFRIWVSVFVLVSVPHRLLPISLRSNKI